MLGFETEAVGNAPMGYKTGIAWDVHFGNFVSPALAPLAGSMVDEGESHLPDGLQAVIGDCC